MCQNPNMKKDCNSLFLCSHIITTSQHIAVTLNVAMNFTSSLIGTDHTVQHTSVRLASTIAPDNIVFLIKPQHFEISSRNCGNQLPVLNSATVPNRANLN